jgi:K+-transporting ATPase KdpF subunit
MGTELIIGGILSILLGIYLVFSIIFPEKF